MSMSPLPKIGEVRARSTTGAEKGRKAQRFSLIPKRALARVAEHYAAGSEKYEDWNWRKGYPWSWSLDSLYRHLAAFEDGEDIDPETGTHHLAAVAWHALTLLTFVEEHPELDDRYKREDQADKARART
jgi:hypothetical protein